jgi:hypothetical protein
MSGNVYYNLVRESDKSDWGLSRCEERLGRTCLVQEPDMSVNLYGIRQCTRISSES